MNELPLRWCTKYKDIPGNSAVIDYINENSTNIYGKIDSKNVKYPIIGIYDGKTISQNSIHGELKTITFLPFEMVLNIITNSLKAGNMQKREIRVSLEEARRIYEGAGDAMRLLLLTSFSREELEYHASEWPISPATERDKAIPGYIKQSKQKTKVFIPVKFEDRKPDNLWYGFIIDKNFQKSSGRYIKQEEKEFVREGLHEYDVETYFIWLEEKEIEL